MNMYVSNLSFHTTEDDLRQLFAAYGDVSSAKVINDRETGKSRGFGFVEMPDDNSAKEAMRELQGKEIEGRELKVTIAREKEGGNKRDSFSKPNNFRKW
jgi:RNA recognition motif-containing protein